MKLHRPLVLAFAAVVLLGLASRVGVAAVDDLLSTAYAQGSVRVIVKMRAPGMLPEAALRDDRAAIAAQRRDIRDLQNAVLSALAGTSHRLLWQYTTSPFAALEVTPDALLALRASPLVESIARDFELVAHLSQSGPLVQTPSVHAGGITGGGQAVVIVDTGVDRTHPFLSKRILEEWCFVTSVSGACPNGQTGPGAANPVDTHGTHVAGIGAGFGVSFSGMAPGSGIIAMRVFSPSGTAQLVDVKAALDRVILLKDSRTIAAVNMSLGIRALPFSDICDWYDAPFGLKVDIDALRAAGIATVVSTGNDGSASGIAYPACLSNTVKVGASTKADAVAAYSNLAPALEATTLLAPGGDGSLSGAGNVCSSIASGFLATRGTCSDAGGGGAFGFEAGTSMAAPHVSGAWALLKQTKPTATVDEVLAAFRAGALLITDPSSGTGYRRIRIRDAMNRLNPLSVTGLTADVPLPAVAGTTITWTATATGGIPPLQYEFWRRDRGVWQRVQAYSASNTYTWTPGGGDVGDHVLQVLVRNAGSTAAWEAQQMVAFTITGNTPTVTGLTADVPLPAVAGTTITWTATATGGIPPLQYEFWRRDRGVWQRVQAYSASNTYTWTPGGGDVGDHALQVLVRSAGSTETWEAQQIVFFTIQ